VLVVKGINELAYPEPTGNHVFSL